MILIWIMNFFVKIAYWIVTLIPDLEPISVDVSSSLALMAPALSIFPLDMFTFILKNGVFWIGIHLTWSVIEWVYKKLPGVD